MDLITILLGIWGGLATIWAVRIERKNYKISYLVDSVSLFNKKLTALLGHDVDIKLFVDNTEINQAFIYTIFFLNNGNSAITEEMYKTGIIIKVHGAKILSANVRDPNLLGVSLRKNQEDQNTSVEVKPLLLNPRDAFMVVLILEGDNPKKLSVSGRIINIQKIQEITPTQNVTELLFPSISVLPYPSMFFFEVVNSLIKKRPR